MDDWVTAKAGLWTGLWTEIWTQNKCGRNVQEKPRRQNTSKCYTEKGNYKVKYWAACRGIPCVIGYRKRWKIEYQTACGDIPCVARSVGPQHRQECEEPMKVKAAQQHEYTARKWAVDGCAVFFRVPLASRNCTQAATMSNGGDGIDCLRLSLQPWQTQMFLHSILI